MITRVPPALFSSDLEAVLARLGTTERKAILFGLSERLLLNQVQHMTWSDVRRRHLTATGEAILRSLPQHLHTNLLFWNMVGTRPMPLLGLGSRLRKAGTLEYQDWLAHYPRLVWLESTYLQRAAQDFRACLMNTVSRSRMRA